MIRISDIAMDVGVSRSLVSKVLSGRMGNSSVRPDLAQAIKARASEAGYVPNASATALTSGRQNVVGVFLYRYGQPGSCMVESVMEGISEELTRNGQRLLLQFFHSREELESCLETAHRNMLDGVMLAGFPDFDIKPYLQQMLDRNLSVVTMMGKPPLPQVSNIGIDPVEVGRLATAHLIEQGCRRIVHLRRTASSTRFKGYRLALEEAGIPFHSELVLDARTYAAHGIPRVFGNFLASGASFDGVFAASDQQASVVLRVLFHAHKNVPGDVKVIGVDDSPFCRHAIVPLSSISGQDRKRSIVATRMLLDSINGKPPQHQTLQPIVVARDSTFGTVSGTDET